MLLLILAITCAVYFAVIIAYAGTTSSFVWFWLAAAGVFSLLYAIPQLIRRGRLLPEIPLWLKVSTWTTAVLGAVVAVFVEMLVIIGMFSQANPEDLDYLIVLGTQVNGEEPTKSLAYRLDKAIEYMEEDEELIVIVSGGQSQGGDVTEAYAMARYLMNHGISSTRILLEDEAANTRENLIFSYGMIKDEDAAVGFVTNSFHVCRAALLADKLGFDEAVGIAAPSDKVLLPHNMVREFFAIIKEKIMGYI